jgi:hypothetical protein
MGAAKAIVVKPIIAQAANAVVRAYHYSGKVVNNSQLHFGVYLDGVLLGAMSFGHPIDRYKLLGLVRDTKWTGMMELNRMAFSDRLPRNSESRALAVAFRLIRQHYPHIKWVVSFADATQSGDGTIYRAAGCVLTGIKPNRGLWRLPTGEVVADIVTRQVWNNSTRRKLGFNLGERWSTYSKRVGAVCLPGFQLRYVYFLDPSWRDRLTVPVLPFSAIAEAGAGMYRGVRRSSEADKPMPVGGATPTPPLQLQAVLANG